MIDDLALPSLRSRGVAAPLGVAASAVALLAAATVAAHLSTAAFIACGVSLVVLVAIAAVRWPRTAVVLVALSPIVDRYIVADLMPADIVAASHFLSEALLLSVSVILAVRAWAAGRLVPALRSPVTLALLAFTAIAAASAVANGVPPHIALLGFVFTLDAAALFFLPALVGFSLRQALAAIGVVGGMVVVAAILALGQALLTPRLFGMEPVRGRFGEELRLASFFGDPNVFGSFLVIVVPFALIAAARLQERRLRWLAAATAFVLLLALCVSFSRGSWIALVLGVGGMLAIVDRRALLIGVVGAVLAFGTAVYMPRNLLLPDQPRPNIVDSTVDRVGAIGIGGDLRTLFVLQSIPIIREHPLIGVGPGRFGGAVAHEFPTPLYEEYGFEELFWNPSQRTVDNFWLHLLVETGVLGAAAFLAAALIPGIRILRGAQRSIGWRHLALGGIAAATAGLAVGSGTTMLLEANSIGFAFWLLLGLGALVVAAGGREEERHTDGVGPVERPPVQRS